MLAFLFHSQGLPQRAIALLAMTIDLVGVIGVSIAALFLSGQELAAIPQGMGSLVVWCVGIWTAINLIAIYAYHLADPSEMTEIRLRSLQDRIQSEALDQVESQVRDEAAGLAGEIAHELRADVLARLRLTGRDFPQLPARDEAAEVGSDPLSSKPPKAR